MKSGIYKITCISNGLCYIGQSKDVLKRIKGHVSDLRKGRHHNKRLQRSYNKYGANNFAFRVVVKCDISLLDEYEKNRI